MKLLDKYLPPLSDGEYTIRVIQSTETISPDPKDFKKTVSEKDEFKAQKQFSVLNRGFSLLQDDVFSVYPGENAQGDFSKELPFLVSGAKTLPWLYDNKDLPWVALIAIGEGEEVREQDMSISQLLSEKYDTLYFPVAGMPDKYVEEKSDSCHVVDVERSLFCSIMPRKAEMEYLCHAKYTDLSGTEEHVSGMDGFFSVMMGSRFIPRGKVTIHLVSMLGYPDCESSMYDFFTDVRLVSLYHWSVFCEAKSDADFKSVIEKLDTKAFGGIYANILSKRGVCAKVHYTRSGDATGSLYHSPLVPYKPEEIPQVMGPCHSADSVLIYDRDKGVFDVTYSAAWQLGRIMVLSRKSVTRAITGLRTGILKNAMKRKMKMAAEEMKPDYGQVCKGLLRALGKGK